LLAINNLTDTTIYLTEFDQDFGEYNFSPNSQEWFDAALHLLEDIKRIPPYSREEKVNAIIEYIGQKYNLAINSQGRNNPFSILSDDHLAKLSNHPLITIGSHSHCHQLLDKLPISRAMLSIELSKLILEKLTQKRIDHFSYPNGNYNDTVVNIVRQLGFVSAVAYSYGWLQPQMNRYKINRIGIGPHTSIGEMQFFLSGILNYKAFIEKFKRPK
jgi:peptidoglycan/xylan/chitin deacetylase (PgdA/CDA1 family)